MHEYRRFIQDELDARGWGQADLVKASGLRRQLVWKILHDERDALGQMPDQATMDKIADGFRIPVERVMTAAARSLVRYSDEGQPISMSLADVHVDALLAELRRRVVNGSAGGDAVGDVAPKGTLAGKMGARRGKRGNDSEKPGATA